MKVLIIHNKYGKFSGEESVIEKQKLLLLAEGIEVKTYFRDSDSINSLSFGKVKAFFSGFYNYRSITEIKELIQTENPDIVHIHNLFPLISPASLPIIKKMGIPIVMTVHNYRLMCPNGLFYSKGSICEKCTSGLMEFNCVLRNCEKSIFKSTGYALRNFWARLRGYYVDNIDIFFCLTEFQKKKMISNGYPSNRIVVLPNFYHNNLEKEEEGLRKNQYVAFAGRISKEKGIDVLLLAAKKLPHIQFQLAGKLRGSYNFISELPDNFVLKGELNEDELKQFYTNARFLVQPSECYEGFPMVFPEAMVNKLPIIAPNMGGFPEIVVDQENGLLFEPFNLDSLVSCIETLWNNDELVNRLGDNGLKKVTSLYNSKLFSKELIKNYKICLSKYESKRTC